MSAPHLFAGLLPADVHVVETRTELDEGQRFWQEEPFIASAVPERQREFRTVRVLARKALANLGYPPIPLVSDERRAPVWPEGIVGSMSHCAGFRVAAVAPKQKLRGIGIDAELHVPLPADIVEIILLPKEQRMVAALSAADPTIAWDRLIFSAKESVFKTWFPLTRTWLDFLECEISINPQQGSFEASIRDVGRLSTKARLAVMRGRWKTEAPSGRGVLGTAIAIA